MTHALNFTILFLAIFLNVATKASANQHSNYLQDHIMYKRTYGWGLPLQFHDIAPGKISKYKREKKEAEAAKQDVTAEIISSTSKSSKKNKKGKQIVPDSFDCKIHRNKMTSASLNGELKNDPDASLASQPSTKKNRKKMKEFASFSVAP